MAFWYNTNNYILYTMKPQAINANTRASYTTYPSGHIRYMHWHSGYEYAVYFIR